MTSCGFEKRQQRSGFSRGSSRVTMLTESGGLSRFGSGEFLGKRGWPLFLPLGSEQSEIVDNFFRRISADFNSESSDDEKDGNTEGSIPKELGRSSEFKGTKFVDDVLKGPNESCLENFRMDKHLDIIYELEQFRSYLDIQPPKSDVPQEIREDPRFYPYFLNCVGAVDGIHFPVTVGVDEQGPFRNKNGFLSQNVLAACSFDMKFHYVLAGWEGSAPDMQVLNSALTRRNKLEVPDGKYYLVDAKYANISGFIAPYPGVSYSQQLEFGGGFHPQDARELFNQRHSILHNVTNRTFAALKERFPILMSAPSYPLATQVKLIVAACALHNYIRSEQPDDWIFKMYEQEALLQAEDPMPPLEIEQPLVPAETQVSDIPFGTQELEHASQIRDAIATEIWNDYIRDYAAIDDVI
ncbi:hypothetical protein Salat_2047000 [Sesamum alatum]|uniref:DDE Tnp4 domain-containing protein n=1 Tax=Sesamum alatum TaxID=300844 RepID=A0AAE2CG97_9LAMI|nr:hypothetical protein Salat_2047000 [Sesamum alatum]